MQIEQYETGEFYDELFESPGIARPAARPLIDHLKRIPEADLLKRQTIFLLGIKEQEWVAKKREFPSLL